MKRNKQLPIGYCTPLCTVSTMCVFLFKCLLMNRYKDSLKNMSISEHRKEAQPLEHEKLCSYSANVRHWT